ncbi:Equilibrative nucleotide transporter 3 [Zea mays]|uniref:Equilibrative nucleotide transporter 3 n=1 Tax=Zea mays TaxID=4577 RepID=A0A3L6DWU6_MAIZE|nr:Equilibrative nucleotide transporter 3 [Zea mays]
MYGSPVSKDLNLPVQPPMASSGLLRYRSAPSTVLGDLCEDFLSSAPRAASPDAGADNVFSRFLADHHIRDDKPSPLASAAVHFPTETDTASQQQQQQQMMFDSQQQQEMVSAKSGLYRTVSSGVETAVAAGAGGASSSANASNLIRQSSSPAGFLDHLNMENGYGAMLRAGMATADSLAGGGSRLKGQLSFSSRQGSLMSQISEMDSEEVGGSSPEAAGGGGGRGYIPGYPMGSGWEDSSALLSDNLPGIKRPRDSSEPGQSGLTHQFSVPKTSSEMATIEKFLQFQDAVPCKIRAKRGCATHPRSIAERVRRTKISERIRKLQELVPNMDKQTNTSDMLDLAVDYIKDLQKQLKCTGLMENNAAAQDLESYHPTRVLTLVYQPFAVGTALVLAHRGARINTRARNLAGYTLFFLSSLALILLDAATSGRGGMAAFAGVCVVSAAFGVADAHVQGGMVGDLSLMCPEFVQSFLAGFGASGALTSALRFTTKAAFESTRGGFRKGAMLFLAVSCIFELLCVLAYAFVFPRLPIVKHYRARAASEGSLTVAADLAAAGITGPAGPGSGQGHTARLSNKELLLQNKDLAADVFLIYVLTLSVFPGFLSEDTGSHGLGSWYVLVLIAAYNTGDLVGRCLPLARRLRLACRARITAAAAARFLLVPAFYLAGRWGGGQGYTILLTAVLGLSNGYLSTSPCASSRRRPEDTRQVLALARRGWGACMLRSALRLSRAVVPYAHRFFQLFRLQGPEQNALGNVLVACLLAGISTGVALDWLWLIGKGW